MRLILTRSHVIQPLVAQGSPRRQVALVVTESAGRVGQSLAERVVGLELKTAGESSANFSLQRMIVGHRVVAEKRDAGGIRIRDKEVCRNTSGRILAIRSVRR